MKVRVTENYRVIVTPNMLERGFSKLDAERYAHIEKGYCNDIVDGIKRHVDNWRHINIEYDVKTICSFCGRTWEEFKGDEELPDGLPACCQEAQDEFYANKEKENADKI